MSVQRYGMVRGSAIRATALDSCGSVIGGTNAGVVSSGVVTVVINEVSNASSEVVERNQNDDVVLYHASRTKPLGFSVEIEFCNVDPALFSLLTGQPILTDIWSGGVGFGVDISIDPYLRGVGLEIWSKVVSGNYGQHKWGYTVFPFLKGGRVTGFTVENKLVNFKVTGMATQRYNKWGVGPWPVVADQFLAPTYLPNPVGPERMWQNLITQAAPPLERIGYVPLVPFIDGGSAAVTTADVIDGLTANTTDVSIVDGQYAYTGGDQPAINTCNTRMGNHGFGVGPFGLVPFGH